MLAQNYTHHVNHNFYNGSMASHSSLGMSPWKNSVMKILNRRHVSPPSLDVSIDHEVKAGADADSATLVYSAHGDVRASTLMEAIHLSLAHFSGAQQNSPAWTVFFRVELNGNQIGDGKVQF